jgi:hypothetical protein
MDIRFHINDGTRRHIIDEMLQKLAVKMIHDVGALDMQTEIIEVIKEVPVENNEPAESGTAQYWKELYFAELKRVKSPSY